MSSLKQKQHKGFSLVEVLIYLAILSAVFLAVANVFLTMSRTYASVKIGRDINSAAMVSLERMIREVRGAESIDPQSVFGVSPGKLVVQTRLDSGDLQVLEFFVDNGMVKIKEDGVDKGAMIPSDVRVESLTFWKYESVKSKGVKIEMELAGLEDQIPIARKFQSFAVMRESYSPN